MHLKHVGIKFHDPLDTILKLKFESSWGVIIAKNLFDESQTYY